MGRFISADTIVQSPSDPQTLNRYSYCGNNPVNRVDPDGHFFKKLWNWFKKNTIVGGFIEATQTGDWGQFGRQVAVLVVSAAANVLLPGIGATFSSNFLVNTGLHILRGAAVGAVVGGITSSIMGDSFAQGAAIGGITGGVMGAFQGVTTSEQYQNWRAGDGFYSNRTVRFKKWEQKMEAMHAQNVNAKNGAVERISRPLGKDRLGNPGSTTGPHHNALISSDLPNGTWEMGPDANRLIQTTNTAGQGWSTAQTTQKSLALGGDYIDSFNVGINRQGLLDAINLYEQTFVGTTDYRALSYNSNYAVNSVIYAAGGNIPNGGRAPGFPTKP